MRSCRFFIRTWCGRGRPRRHRRAATAGHRPVVFRAGKIRLGDVICYEVGFDGLELAELLLHLTPDLRQLPPELSRAIGRLGTAAQRPSRADRQREIDAGRLPDFLPETAAIRGGASLVHGFERYAACLDIGGNGVGSGDGLGGAAVAVGGGVEVVELDVL